MKIANLIEQIRDLIDELPENARGELARVQLAIELVEDVEGAEAPIAALQVQRDAAEARINAVAERCKKARRAKWDKANTIQWTVPSARPSRPHPVDAPPPVHHSPNEARPYWVKPDGTISFDPPEFDR